MLTKSIALGIACALLASGTAAAQQDLRNPDNRSASPASSLASTASRQDLRGPDAIDAARADRAALADATPVPAPPARTQSPAPADDTPWLSIAIVVGATFAIGGAIAAQARRRRTARVTA